MRVDVLYFASLRDAAGRDVETVDTEAGDVGALYSELAARHGFGFAPKALRAAIDGSFVPWDAPLRPGAEVAYLPPVSGG